MNKDYNDNELLDVLDEYILAKRSRSDITIDDFIQSYPADSREKLCEYLTDFEEIHSAASALHTYEVNDFPPYTQEQKNAVLKSVSKDIRKQNFIDHCGFLYWHHHNRLTTQLKDIWKPVFIMMSLAIILQKRIVSAELVIL